MQLPEREKKMNKSELFRLTKKIVKNIPVKAINGEKIDEKFVEIVIRRSDGKISSMVKCALDDEENKKIISKVLQKVPVGGMNGVGTISSLANNVQTEMVRREVKKVGKDVKEVLDLTKDIAANVDKIAQGMSVVQSLSVLNVALSAANMGVSIAGFTMMNKKLDALHQEIHKIYEIVTDLKDIKINEIVNEGYEIIDKTKGLYQHIIYNDAEIKEYEYILGKYRSYIRNLRGHVVGGQIDFERGYGIIMGLLPPYVDILKKYIVVVYYAKGQFPQYEYDTHISVIESLANQEFLEKFFDFAYLDHDISKIDSETAEGIHFFLVGNFYTAIEDTRELIFALPKKKNYMDFEKAIAIESQKRLLNALPEKLDESDYDREELARKIQDSMKF